MNPIAPNPQEDLSVNPTENPLPTTPAVGPVPENSPIDTTPSLIGLTGSQLEQDKKKKIPIKLLLKITAGLVVIASILMVLVFTGVFAFSEFKRVDYANSTGSSFSLDFYTKHKTETLSSGNTQLISSVAKDSKFPISLSISEEDESTYSRLRSCSGFETLTTVTNSSISQDIQVCIFNVDGSDASILLSAFKANEKVYAITIAQDLDVNLSSPESAQDSLAKVGIDVYKQDVEKIIKSISLN